MYIKHVLLFKVTIIIQYYNTVYYGLCRGGQTSFGHDLLKIYFTFEDRLP